MMSTGLRKIILKDRPPVISGCGFMDPQLLEEIAHRYKNVLCEYVHATCTLNHCNSTAV